MFAQAIRNQKGWASARTEEASRGERLTAFLRTIQKANGVAYLTPLQFEELGKVALDRLREAVQKERGLSWDELRQEPDWPEPFRKLARVYREMHQFAVDAANASGCVLTTIPLAPNAQAAAETAKAIRTKHRDLLATYPAIDSMDALHIALGAALQCSAYLTLDRGWQEVPVDGFALTVQPTT